VNTALPGNSRASERGSVFVLVLWISFGMVVLALYFAHSMNFELRAGDNRVAALEADHAINGAARYVEYVLTHHGTNGMVPDTTLYSAENVPIGSASTTTRSTDLTGVPAFWMLGRDAEATSTTIPTGVPTFGLIDEASKLNLNATNLTTAMLELLPGMTPAIAAAILDWRDADSTTTEEGAEDDLYQRLIPARSCKNGNFESVDELRLVYGVTLAMLYGEDLNQNGVLDINENDGERTLPPDNLDGRLDPGFLEYFTIYSRQPNITVLGSNRVDIANRQALTTLLTEKISQARATAIIQALGPTNNPVRSILEFYSRSGMTEDEFELVETELTAVPGPHVEGLVNVNTASEAVLGCIPGIGVEVAPNIVAQRRNNPKNVNTLAWVKEVLTTEQIAQAGPYLTGQSYQFTADVVALGHNGRGHQRARFVFDMTENVPKILHREDLSRFGWALGKEVRHEIRAGIASSLRK
jgi:type II secretory pathway component PulK